MSAEERICLITNKKGLHARAAAKMVKTAQHFQAAVMVRRHVPPAQGELMQADDASVVATSILGLMMLGAQKGVELHLSAEGTDAHAALEALEALIANRFDEDE